MKISVIIPAYNAERWVSQCIENMLCQSHRELEVIVVDDGSTDATAQVVERYAAHASHDARAGHDARSKPEPLHPEIILIRQPNAGPSMARNRGLEAATGSYVHFMDVDDLVNLDFYSRMAEAALLTGADMAACGMVNENIPSWSYHYGERCLLVELEDKFVGLNVYDLGYAVRYLLRREFLLERGLRFEPGRLIEDMPLVHHATLWASKVVTVPGATYYYKRRESSALNCNDREHVARIKAEWRRAAAARRDFFASHGLQKALPHTHVWQMRVLGLPLLIKKRSACGHTTSWHLLGLKIASRKRLKDQPERMK